MSRLSIGAAIILSVAVAIPAQAGVDISTKATQNMSCANGVCSPSAKNAVLNVNDVTTMLAAGDLKITTGSGALDIHVKAPFSWANTSRLTLDAMRSITIDKAVVVAGTGALTLVTNDGGTGGDYWFDKGASVSLWDTSSSLIINGQSFTLVKDIKTLAAEIAANPSGNFALANDYDASADYYSGSPVATELTGTFEGLGHTISNLYLSPSGYVSVALFAEASGTLRDLDLQNVRVETGGGSAASLLLIDDAATIIGCDATGTVLGELGAAGGLVAVSSDAGGVIIRSHAAVDVSTVNAQGPQGPAGGLVGRSSRLKISRSSASGQVIGFNAGGLVGEMNGGSVSQSFASGQVMGENAGGVVGDVVGSSSIQDSYATGRVHSYQSGSRGGFAGYFGNSMIHSSYSIGAVNRRSQGLKGNRGGFVGIAGGGDDLKWDYWDIDTSGMTQGCGDGDCNGVTGQSDAQMKSALPDGFAPKIWGQNPNINNGYPYLLANPPPK